MDLEHVVFAEIFRNEKQVDVDDLYFFKDAYKWLEKEVGFFPIFLAVGTTLNDIRMTGYQGQWGRFLSWSPEEGGKYRKKGEFPNRVLFSFDEIDGIYMDFDAWHLVLNSQHNNYQLTEYEKRLMFRYSWSKADWLRRARKDPESVQLVTPKLDLRKSKRIEVRNKSTKKKLEEIGFTNVKVNRITLADPT